MTTSTADIAARPEFNVYADARRAEAYATLAFPGTYYLAYRDLPAIIGRHATGRRGLDLGCGAGRSTRFLRGLGFDAVGADISAEMVRVARELDPSGDYRVVGDGDYAALALDGRRFDLVLSVFTFDNVPTRDRKRRILQGLRPLLSDHGRIVSLVSSPDIYTHEWASFSTSPFPENRRARDGDVVRTIILDTPDHRPVDDVLCGDEAYREIYAEAGYTVEALHRPLGRPDDPVEWVTEATIPPWSIYVLGPGSGSPGTHTA
jgi:SAM-dependent methyltransferase